MNDKLKLYHPWWTHLPALAGAAIMAIAFASTKTPERVPIHFNLSGVADGWGSPSTYWIVFLAIPLLFIAGSFVLDELHCRFEKRKQFNFLALFDEAFVGFFMGLEIATLPILSDPKPMLKGEMKLGLCLAAAMAALAAIAELMRKHVPKPSDISAPGADAQLSEADQASIAKGRHWLHWETQNPLYLRIVMIAVLLSPLLPLIAGHGKVPLWIPAVMIAVFLPISAVFYNGMRVTVTPELLTVRFGIFGIPLLKIPLERALSAEAVNYNPLGDFGGWGIRYSISQKTWAYALHGSSGVRIETANGKRYIIGSDDAKKLAAICKAAILAKASAGKPQATSA